jgi:hypothetical protein
MPSAPTNTLGASDEGRPHHPPRSCQGPGKRVKDRVIYGEVLDIADGVVRFRPLCPAAGWHSATARQVVGHWRKVGRRGGGERDKREPPSDTAQQLLLPETES